MAIDKQLPFLMLTKEFTSVIRRGRRPIISPEDSNPPINLDNAFTAIDPSRQSDSNDDQSSQDDQSRQDTNQSISSDDDSDYGISTMTITIRKEITDLMTAIVPIAEQTVIDLQDFHKNVANALFTQKSRATKTGHAGDTTAVLPTSLIEPIEPTGASPSPRIEYLKSSSTHTRPPNIGTKKSSTCSK